MQLPSSRSRIVDPSSGTALVLPVRLPAPLESVRRRSVADARLGMPAHATLLYPFVAAGALDADLRSRLAQILADHEPFAFRLASRGRWPATLFASIEPEGPFRSLHDHLAAAFPEFPIYGGAHDFVPHVTVAEGAAADDPAVIDHPAWRSLPAPLVASVAELIIRDAESWRVSWRFDLGVRKVPA